MRITSKGLDFLEDDGGLSAILGKVIIKFDETDLDHILKSIDNAKGTQEQKESIKKILKNLPADSLKTAYMRILNLRFESLPDALSSLQEILRKLN